MQCGSSRINVNCPGTCLDLSQIFSLGSRPVSVMKVSQQSLQRTTQLQVSSILTYLELCSLIIPIEINPFIFFRLKKHLLLIFFNQLQNMHIFKVVHCCLFCSSQSKNYTHTFTVQAKNKSIQAFAFSFKRLKSASHSMYAQKLMQSFQKGLRKPPDDITVWFWALQTHSPQLIPVNQCQMFCGTLISLLVFLMKEGMACAVLQDSSTDGLLLTSLHRKSLVKNSVLESTLLQNILIIYFEAQIKYNNHLIDAQATTQQKAKHPTFIVSREKLSCISCLLSRDPTLAQKRESVAPRSLRREGWAHAVGRHFGAVSRGLRTTFCHGKARESRLGRSNDDFAKLLRVYISVLVLIVAWSSLACTDTASMLARQPHSPQHQITSDCR